MSELKPCPFCGGIAELETHIFYGLPSTYGVRCEKCKVQTWDFYESKEEAISAWNERTEDEHTD